MRCPACGSFDDKVVDSRQSEDGTSIRRRRACLACQRRYTTFERLEEVPLLVVKRSGDREPYDVAKVVAGLAAATKGRPVDAGQLDDLAGAVEESLRLEGPEVPSEEVGRAVLERLRDLDVVAAVRFASVYKEFDDLADFERELTELTHSALTKATEPKRH
ncbi:transcriptional regulator NrdR [Aquihabitans sp. G128]|uniref:transcriptional regulator NrdR n=1 Tax=Aquihabitans sp. G128 TaxID=2849779 RepID=UPI001C225A0C|nr:transcriptional regulator NrdR [Aquihabitans sp. G128]QXC62492.1 transcriptional regulator NrdR [Aquihabitans sp. G128]